MWFELTIASDFAPRARNCHHMRHEEDDGEERECSADHTAADPEHTDCEMKIATSAGKP
jgi:hypothetical protein